jgi:hypothetical protein
LEEIRIDVKFQEEKLSEIRKSDKAVKEVIWPFFTLLCYCHARWLGRKKKWVIKFPSCTELMGLIWNWCSGIENSMNCFEMVSSGKIEQFYD